MHRDAIHLADIIKSARMIREYVSGAFAPKFSGKSSVVGLRYPPLRNHRRGGGTGLATVSRRETPTFPGLEMRGMRNRVIHRYDDVDMELVWETVEQDIPRLIVQLEGLVPEEQS